jgi:hypothetical protein
MNTELTVGFINPFVNRYNNRLPPLLCPFFFSTFRSERTKHIKICSQSLDISCYKHKQRSLCGRTYGPMFTCASSYMMNMGIYGIIPFPSHFMWLVSDIIGLKSLTLRQILLTFVLFNDPAITGDVM